MANVNIPEEREEVYYRLTLHRSFDVGPLTAGATLIDNRVPIDCLEDVLAYHKGLGHVIDKIERVYVLTTVEVTDVPLPKAPETPDPVSVDPRMAPINYMREN